MKRFEEQNNVDAFINLTDMKSEKWECGIT